MQEDYLEDTTWDSTLSLYEVRKDNPVLSVLYHLWQSSELSFRPSFLSSLSSKTFHPQIRREKKREDLATWEIAFCKCDVYSLFRVHNLATSCMPSTGMPIILCLARPRVSTSSTRIHADRNICTRVLLVRVFHEILSKQRQPLVQCIICMYRHIAVRAT